MPSRALRGSYFGCAVARPALVRVDGIDAEADRLHVALVELGLQLRDVTELGRADRREVTRMREEDPPLVAQPLVELDLAIGRIGGEVRRGVSEAQHG